MFPKKLALINHLKNIGSLRRFASSLIHNIGEAPKAHGQAFKRYKSKCGDKGGKSDKKGKKGKKDNLSVVLHGVDDLRIEQTPMPKLRKGQVLLAMDTVGICGTDVHFLAHGKVGTWVLKKPMVIGHEASGIVAKLGKGVKNLKEGDRVAIEPGQFCHYCEFCKAGAYNLCPKIIFSAAPPDDGNLRRYINHAAECCFKLPDHVTMEEGALVEPLAVAVAACRRAKIRLGSNVLIIGAGPVGLASLIVAKAWGATCIAITDLNEHRLKVAQDLGVTHAFKICKGIDAKLAAKEICKTMGVKPDKTLDCVGMEESVWLGVYATRPSGTCTVVGLGSDVIKLPLMEAVFREVDIKGVYRYCHDYQPALDLVSTRNTGVKKLVTHHFDIEQSVEAFDTARHAKGNSIKVLIHVQKRDKNNKTPFDNKK